MLNILIILELQHLLEHFQMKSLQESFDGGVNSGNVMKVNHFNHGMYSYTNKVKIRTC